MAEKKTNQGVNIHVTNGVRWDVLAIAHFMPWSKARPVLYLGLRSYCIIDEVIVHLHIMCVYRYTSLSLGVLSTPQESKYMYIITSCACLLCCVQSNGNVPQPPGGGLHCSEGCCQAGWQSPAGRVQTRSWPHWTESGGRAYHIHPLCTWMVGGPETVIPSSATTFADQCVLL